MANPKQFGRNKSHRQFLGFYLMNRSTWQLKEKPFHLKAKLKPSVAVPLEAATRWCWVLVPSPAPWAARLCKYSVLCSPHFHNIFCYKEMPSSSSPCSHGRQDRRPTVTGFPRSSRKEWWPYCLMTIQFLPSRCTDLLEGDKLHQKG